MGVFLKRPLLNSRSQLLIEVMLVAKLISHLLFFSGDEDKARILSFARIVVVVRIEAREKMINPSEYAVLDVETNGFDASCNDLLSISIYLPDLNYMYNRLLPLELQTALHEEATAVNGITLEQIAGCKPLSRDEADEIVDLLKGRRVLQFAPIGKKESFDELFLKKYFERHGFTGLENIHFDNVKDRIFNCNSYEYSASKDNLCRALGIDGVLETHTSANDCLLEWALFEKINEGHLLITDGKIFRLSPEYKVAATYVDQCPSLRRYLGLPDIKTIEKRVFEYTFSPACSRAVKRFSTNISGISLERIISDALGLTPEDTISTQVANKRRNEYLGRLPPNHDYLPVSSSADGKIHVGISAVSKVREAVFAAGDWLKLREYLSLRNVRDNDYLINPGNEVLEELRQAHEELKRRKDVASCLFSEGEEKGHKYREEQVAPLVNMLSEVQNVRETAAYANEITTTNNAIKSEIGPIVDKIREILGGRELRYQELVEDYLGCSAVCDFSSADAILEAKSVKDSSAARFKYQLLISSCGRRCYMLGVKWGDQFACGKAVRTSVFINEVHFEGPGRKRYRPKDATVIKHAVGDWRAAHPSEPNYKKCAAALCLKPEDVLRAWDEKTDPSNICRKAPSTINGKENLAKLKEYLLNNPNASRQDAINDIEINRAFVEKYWHLARYLSMGSDGLLSDERLRGELRELSNPDNLVRGYNDADREEISLIDEKADALERQIELKEAEERGRCSMDLQLLYSDYRHVVDDLIALRNDKRGRMRRKIGMNTSIVSIKIAEDHCPEKWLCDFDDARVTFCDAGLVRAKPQIKQKSIVSFEVEVDESVFVTISNRNAAYQQLLSCYRHRLYKVYFEQMYNKTLLASGKKQPSANIFLRLVYIPSDPFD